MITTQQVNVYYDHESPIMIDRGSRTHDQAGVFVCTYIFLAVCAEDQDC